jgi:hypothetical protein
MAPAKASSEVMVRVFMGRLCLGCGAEPYVQAPPRKGPSIGVACFWGKLAYLRAIL